MSDTEFAMEPVGAADTLLFEAVEAAAWITEAAVAAMGEAASWLSDLTIMRPLGPMRGLIFLEEGIGGVLAAMEDAMLEGPRICGNVLFSENR